MKILLLGHKGYLGSYLHSHLTTDVLDNSKRQIYNNGGKYDYVINCIGKPDLEYCETNIKETDYSNYEVLKDIKSFYPTAKIINFSSYYVYDDNGLCTENSHTTNTYAYCRQKLLGEKEVTNGVTFRIGKLFGNPYAKQQKLTEYILENNDVTLDEVQFNPTSVDQIFRVVQYELVNHSLSGIYNLANTGITSHYEYGVFINTFLRSGKSVHKVSKITRKFKNYGRFVMSVEKLNNIIPLTSWQKDMKIYLMKVLNNK